MNIELTTKLHKKYPGIFSKEITGHAVGFEHDNGWYDLIDRLCDSIMFYCNSSNIEPPIASQVKEKYGGLRFYVWQASNEVFDIIDKFELESQYICEVCGRKGKIEVKGGWYKCVCHEHFIDWKNRDKWR